LDAALGDLLRGERATRGKSLPDVESELKIRADYIAAIEDADLTPFTSHGFIPGYVRSYARYLGLDPEWTFDRFCKESGFQGVHGFSARQAGEAECSIAVSLLGVRALDDVIIDSRVPFTVGDGGFLPRLEPGALGSAIVLIALIAAIGYGAWAILNDIQRLQFAPVEAPPTTIATTVDPLASVVNGGSLGTPLPDDVAMLTPLDRLYRPQALEVPVLTPRDQPLATLDPDKVGALAPQLPRMGEASAAITPDTSGAVGVEVTERVRNDVLLLAVHPSWVHITSASGAVIFEGTLAAGDVYRLPASEVSPTLRAGNSGSLYFVVNGVTMGPAGPGTSMVRDVILSEEAILEAYAIADVMTDPELAEVTALILGTAEGTDGE